MGSCFKWESVECCWIESVVGSKVVWAQIGLLFQGSLEEVELGNCGMPLDRNCCWIKSVVGSKVLLDNDGLLFHGSLLLRLLLQ